MTRSKGSKAKVKTCNGRIMTCDDTVMTINKTNVFYDNHKEH